MLALAHTLVSEGFYDTGFVSRYCTGFERFRPYLMGEADGQPKNAEWAAEITGVPAETLRQLARRMARTRTMLTLSWSAQRADHGEQPCWMIIVLAALLGQIGLPGGGFGIGYGAIDGLGHMRGNVPAPMLPVPPNPVAFAAPVAKVVDMLLNPGGDLDFNGKRWKYPDVRLLYWSGGNPFHHTPDLNRMLEAWRKPETIVVHEPWWTPAARYADIVLPAATMLERNDIGGSIWDSGFYAIRQAIEPRGEARSDFDIFRALSRRLDNSGQFDEGRDEMGWLRHLYDGARSKGAAKGVEIPSFDEFWRAGRVLFPTPEEPPVPFADFRADPVANALKTPSGKIELFSETIDGFGYAECPGHPIWLEPAEWLGGAGAARYPLHMISNQPKVRLHSQLEMTALSQGSKVAGREPITLHPEDAAARAIKAGDLVRVFNGRGSCLAGALLNGGIRRGVVQLSPGAWFDPVEPGRVGSLDRNGTANVLTRDGHTSPLAQCSVQQSTLVEVERYDGLAPPPGMFTPPSTVERARTG
jgi:biotin/methionine sulfoxide reductase